MTTARGGNDGDYVQSLARGLAVICAFDRAHAELTLSEVGGADRRHPGHRAALPAHPRAAGLRPVRRPVLRADAAVLELGYAYLSGLTLAEVAEPHLEALVAEVNESSSVSVLDGDDIVYVARVPVSRIMTVAISVGTRFPAYATSMGRVLLAGLDDDDADGVPGEGTLQRLTAGPSPRAAALRAELARVRSQGFALVDQELEEGLRSVAAPIRDRTGRVVAAVNISAHASRTSLESMRRTLVPPLLAAAAKISTDLPRTSRRNR